MGWTAADTEKWSGIPVAPDELAVLAHRSLPNEDATVLVNNTDGWNGVLFRWEPAPQTPALGPAFFILDAAEPDEDLERLRDAVRRASGRERRILGRVAKQLTAWIKRFGVFGG